MKKTGILNAELSKAIASMGHTDIMLVVDAGYPIPSDAWRVDLAIKQDMPTTEQVLSIIADELIVEETIVAEDVLTNNAPLNDLVRSLFKAAEHRTVPHDDLLQEYGSRAKVIVRTGAFNPWGNIALSCGVYAPDWFDKEGIVVPEEYKRRIDAILKEEEKK